jgi:hypothetical protein
MEIPHRIVSKLEEIDERLRRVEEEFFDELSEDGLKEFEGDLRAYREGNWRWLTLKRLKEAFIVKLKGLYR